MLVSLLPDFDAFFMFLQVRVQAADGDSPPRTSTEIVTVNVERNLQRPVFTKPGGGDFRQELTIKETESFQKVIFRVEATDADQRVSINNTDLFWLS